MTRIELRQLAEMRLREAHSLFAIGEYSGAYYLAGYSVECALKACIAKQTKEHDFPDRDRAIKSYSHRPKELLVVAKLTDQFEVDSKAKPQLRVSWEIVAEWTEQSRYEWKTERDARVLLEALDSPGEGVLTWLMQHW